MKSFQLEQYAHRIAHTWLVFHQQQLESLAGTRFAHRQVASSAQFIRGCLRDGQIEREHRSESGRGADRNLQVEELGDSLNDGQTQAVALPRTIWRYTDLVELLEDVRKLVGSNANAGVADFDAQPSGVRFATKLHRARLRVLDGVGNEVPEHLP